MAVVAMLSWPSNRCRNRRSTPSSRSNVAQVWRSICGVTRFSTPAARAKRRKSRRTDCVDQSVASGASSLTAMARFASLAMISRSRPSTTNTQRSRLPLPWTLSAPISASKSPGRSWTSSPTLRPTEMSRSTALGNAFESRARLRSAQMFHALFASFLVSSLVSARGSESRPRQLHLQAPRTGTV